MTRMKGMLLATALMIAAAQSNDPFRTPRRNTGVRRYLEGLNIFDPEDLLNTLLRKIAVEPVPKEVQWWEAQGRFENLIGAEFRRGDVQAVLR